MLLDIISLFAGFLCLFVVALMLLNSQPNHKINGYLITILVVVGLQRFLYAVEALGFTTATYNPLEIKPLLAFYIVPVYYLFFSRLIYEKGELGKEALHFIFPTVFFLINLVIVDYTLNRLVYLAYSLLYLVLIMIMVRTFIYKKRVSMLDKISYQAKKSWVLSMLALTILLVIYSNFFHHNGLSAHLDTFYRYSSVFWFLVLFFLFKNPVIIFGEYSLLKDIRLNDLQNFQVWSSKPLKAIDESDATVYNTVSGRVDSIIMEIKLRQKSVPLISKTTLNAETLAKELKIPKRHLDFIFKYYCHYSINDFSNLIKVDYALSLLNEGYLERHTVDSLGKKCLFNSRFTFSKNFKKFVGVSVSNFVSGATTEKDYRQLLAE